MTIQRTEYVGGAVRSVRAAAHWAAKKIGESGAGVLEKELGDAGGLLQGCEVSGLTKRD